MGEIESVIALPDDKTFNQKENKYNIKSYKKIWGKFGIDPSADFHFTHGKNKGLGNVYIWITYSGPSSTHYNYPDPDLALFDDERVMDIKDPNYRANGIYFVQNDQGADKQFEHFVPHYSQGLTKAGLARINQSIEASCYCVLGSHSIQRYQEAIADTKTCLDFAVARGVWLMPSRMVINTESIVGYNNMLRTADAGMKLGVNNQINLETKKASPRLMGGGPNKINPPNRQQKPRGLL